MLFIHGFNSMLSSLIKLREFTMGMQVKILMKNWYLKINKLESN